VTNQVVPAPPNKQLQRTVRHKVPSHIGQRAAAELRRYTATEAISSFELFLGVGIAVLTRRSHRAIHACSAAVGLGGLRVAASASRCGGRLTEHSVAERAVFWQTGRRSRCQQARERKEAWRFHSCWRYAQAVSVAV
jgi:hypothetical protein